MSGAKRTPNGTRAGRPRHLVSGRNRSQSHFSFLFFLKGKENGFLKKYFQLLVTEEEEERMLSAT